MKNQKVTPSSNNHDSRTRPNFMRSVGGKHPPVIGVSKRTKTRTARDRSPVRTEKDGRVFLKYSDGSEYEQLPTGQSVRTTAKSVTGRRARFLTR